MARELCATEILPRIWAIEVLAGAKLLTTSQLIDLIKWTPELSDDIGKNARELICLRLLETFFQGNQKNSGDASAICQKIEFDPSKSCEEVLRHILQEIPASNLILGDSEMLKWNIKPFITHKRDHMPMLALLKLKDAVLESSHSVFASLKERSGVVVRTQYDDNIASDGANPCGPVHNIEERSKDNQIALPNQNSSPNTFENGVDELQEKLPDMNSLPSKRKRTNTTVGNMGKETHENQIVQDTSYAPHAESAKKFKQDIHVSEHAVIERSITSARDGQIQNSSERIVEHIDGEVSNLENEAEKGGMEIEHTEFPHDAGNQYAFGKFKQDVNITEHDAAVKSIKLAGDGPSANSSERSVEHIDREGCNLVKGAEIGGKNTKHTGSTHDGGDQYAALKMLARCSDVFYATDGDRQLQTPIDDNIEVNAPAEVHGQSNYAVKSNVRMEGSKEKASNGTFQCANNNHNCVNEAMSSFHCHLQENTSSGPEADGVLKRNHILETTSNNDEFHDESSNIASKIKAFLSSQCTYDEDSLATQPNICMKCKSGGQLLTCSSSTCPVSVHENCLGSAAKFDGDGKFYCPSCAYSQVLAEYFEAKRKALLARDDLATFIGLQVGDQSNLSMGSHRSEHRQVRVVDESNENNEANTERDPLDEVNHRHLKPTVEDKSPAEPSMSCAGNSSPLGETEADLTHRELKTLGKGNFEGGGREECHSPVQPGEQQIDVQVRSEGQIVNRGQKKVTEQPQSSLPSEPLRQTSCGNSKEDDEKSSALQNTTRSLERQCAYAGLPQLRRKRQPWTKAEEEKLKEGVQMYSVHDLSIPWKTILEFGADVFHKGRTTVDLKDKWRNICKGVGPKSK